MLDPAEVRLRGTTSTAELARRAESGDQAAELHQRILAAAQHVDRQTLYAIVTNPNQALATALQYADTGLYLDSVEVLELNPTTGGHPAGIAAKLIALIAAGDDDAVASVIGQLHQADQARAVLEATTQLQDHLAGDGSQAAATILKTRLENT